MEPHNNLKMGCTASSNVASAIEPKAKSGKAEDAWYKAFLPKHDKMLELLHFNDVYNIEGKEVAGAGKQDTPVVLGGAHRFRTALD